MGKYVSPVNGIWAAGSGGLFGAYREWNRNHAGNDFKAGNGSIAGAMIGGKVIYTGHNSGYQYNAVVQGDDGNAFRYATHGPLKVVVGQRVEAGQAIGVIARGHLHFEVIKGGSPTYNIMVANPGAGSKYFVSTKYPKGGTPRTVDPLTFFGVAKRSKVEAGKPFVSAEAGPINDPLGIEAARESGTLPTPPADIPNVKTAIDRPALTFSPTDRDAGIRTMIGEALEDGEAGMEAVAHVIRNRFEAGTDGKTIAAIATDATQFDAWNHDLVTKYGPGSPEYEKAAHEFDEVMYGARSDDTKGATEFHSGKKAPGYWKKGVEETAKIGGHTFGKLTGKAAPPVQAVAAAVPPVPVTADSYFEEMAGQPPPAIMTQATGVPKPPPNPRLAQSPELAALGNVPPPPQTATKAPPPAITGRDPDAVYLQREKPATARPEVAVLQRSLADKGLYKGAIDGKFGPQTEAAVRAGQRREGLSPDGIAGPVTLASLGLPSLKTEFAAAVAANVPSPRLRPGAPAATTIAGRPEYPGALPAGPSVADQMAEAEMQQRLAAAKEAVDRHLINLKTTEQVVQSSGPGPSAATRPGQAATGYTYPPDVASLPLSASTGHMVGADATGVLDLIPGAEPAAREPAGAQWARAWSNPLLPDDARAEAKRAPPGAGSAPFDARRMGATGSFDANLPSEQDLLGATEAAAANRAVPPSSSGGMFGRALFDRGNAATSGISDPVRDVLGDNAVSEILESGQSPLPPRPSVGDSYANLMVGAPRVSSVLRSPVTGSGTQTPWGGYPLEEDDLSGLAGNSATDYLNPAPAQTADRATMFAPPDPYTTSRLSTPAATEPVDPAEAVLSPDYGRGFYSGVPTRETVEAPAEEAAAPTNQLAAISLGAMAAADAAAEAGTAASARRPSIRERAANSVEGAGRSLIQGPLQPREAATASSSGGGFFGRTNFTPVAQRTSPVSGQTYAIGYNNLGQRAFQMSNGTVYSTLPDGTYSMGI